MRKLLIILSLLFCLSGCSYLHVHKMDIEQGNVITPDMVNRVHTGMGEAEVRNIMGNPVLTNVFDKNHLDYVYTFKPGYGTGTEKYITFVFVKGRLNSINGNMYSEFIK